MKKILFSLFTFLALTGCSLNVSDIDNTPTKKVEAYLNNYQSLNDGVLEDLDMVIEKEEAFADDAKDRYREVMKSNFEDLTYTIKEETVNGDTATVEVELDVTDFYKVIQASEDYKEEHADEFNDESGNYDETKYIDYKLGQMENTSDRVKHTIYFTLTKDEDGNWELDDIDESEEEKILGIYAY